MALNKLKFNSINVTPAAGKGIRFNSSANGLETASAGGSLVKIAATTASSSASVSFTSGIDSTYKEYIFILNNIHPATDGAEFGFNLSVDGGSNYNVAKTSAPFMALHSEDDSEASFAFEAGIQSAQATGTQYLLENLGNDNDQSLSGVLHLFDPSSTTFVKHFMYVGNASKANNQSINFYIGGYGNTTSAVNAIEFKADSGNVDSGTITMYGVT
jgi:hypothetical protein